MANIDIDDLAINCVACMGSSDDEEVSAEDERDKALLCVLFEVALRLGELLTMKVRSVEFKGNYCLTSVKGKTM